MNIIFLSIGFNLDGDNLYNDLIDCLIDNGYNVTICRSDSKIKTTFIEKINDKLAILNIKTGNQFEKNLVRKGINMLLLEYKFKKDIKKYLNRNVFDLILYATPPISLNGVVKYCKKHFNAKTFLMLKDIFPQNAVDLNMMKYNGMIYRFFRRKEKSLYILSDYIGCMSKKNKEYILEHNQISEDKIHIFHNSIKIKDEKVSVNQKVNKETIKIMFGGNLGKPQYIEGLLKVICLLNDYEKVKFIIVGKGTEDYKIKDYINENKPNNLMFYNHLPRKEYETMLKDCDIGLISLDYRFTIPNIPSKLLSYMLLKKPILALTDDNTDLKEIIVEANCGWWINSKDEKAIINKIKEIVLNENLEEKGKNGFVFLKKHFDVKKNVEQIQKFLEENYENQ